MSLEERFKLSAELVKGLKKKPTDDELLKLYGLYKQGTLGNCDTEEPSFFYFKEKAKWRAWYSQYGKKKDKAKEEYCEYVIELTDRYGLEN
jgi:diazepam-binding inhibitor (GABA receptor modulator, acyl-CoA-binding protein)